MKDRISALMDGELEDRDADKTISLFAADPEARSAWRTYHLIGDALREGHAVVVPRRPAANSPRWRVALPAMAAAAAVAFVSWVALMPGRGRRPPTLVPPPGGANDYLLAHQGFSPRVALQGMAPYVLTVSDPAPQDARK